MGIRVAAVEHEPEQRKQQSLGDPREYRGTLRDLCAHGGQFSAPPYPAFRKGGWAGSVQRGEVRAGSDEVRVRQHLRGIRNETRNCRKTMAKKDEKKLMTRTDAQLNGNVNTGVDTNVDIDEDEEDGSEEGEGSGDEGGDEMDQRGGGGGGENAGAMVTTTGGMPGGKRSKR